MRFVSERALNLHKDHVKNEKLRLSVFEKTYPELTGKSIKDIMHTGCKDRAEIARLILNVRSHEIYFSSFGKHYTQSETVRRQFGSEAAFLYEMQKEMIAAEGKFFFIYVNGRKVKTRFGDERELLKTCGNVLAVDLSEHSYFLDYGFDKSEYVRKLLPYLDLSALDKKIFDKH